MDRPFPPLLMLEPEAPDTFEPAPAIIDWAMQTFIMPGSSLYNPEHAHLETATIGALWTNVPNSRHGRAIAGQAELGKPNALGKWAKARASQQVAEWFGGVPDFILTFDAGYAVNCSDMDFTVLVAHELCHLAQAIDGQGEPKFLKDGTPQYAIKAHDFEGFLSIAQRFGAVELNVKRLADALSKPPVFSGYDVSVACGTCPVRAVA
jgi:hypothetical protein